MENVNLIRMSTTTQPKQEEDDEVIFVHDTAQAERDRQALQAVNNILREQIVNNNQVPPVIAPSPELAIAIRNREVEMAFKNSIMLQKMWIPFAEDVSILNDIMILKEETITYMAMTFKVGEGIPAVPSFYKTTVYFFYKLAIQKRQRPIYIQHLGDIVKRRLQEILPQAARIPEFPSLKEIVEFYTRFDVGMGPDYNQKRLEAKNQFELIMGESYYYISMYYQRNRRPPPSIQFLIKFCVLFYQFGFIDSDTAGFENDALARLQRNLPEVHRNSAFFATTYAILKTNLANPLM